MCFLKKQNKQKFLFSKALKQQQQEQQTAAFNATLKEKLDSLQKSGSIRNRPLPDIPSEYF